VKKWEYEYFGMLVDVPETEQSDKLKKRVNCEVLAWLDSLGSEGWELCGNCCYDHFPSVIGLFKREIPQPPSILEPRSPEPPAKTSSSQTNQDRRAKLFGERIRGNTRLPDGATVADAYDGELGATPEPPEQQSATELEPFTRFEIVDEDTPPGSNRADPSLDLTAWGECNCDCHEPGSTYMCPVPCCIWCPSCRLLIAGDFDSHVRQCHPKHFQETSGFVNP